MLQHYFKIALRTLIRNRVFSCISILGLAVGLAVCLIIYQYIRFEQSYDQFHARAHTTYRLTQTEIRNGAPQGSSVFTAAALGPKAKDLLPEIETMVRVHPQSLGLVVANTENQQIHQEDHIWYVDPNFLQLFDFPLAYGDRESALGDLHSVVITEAAALKYFGNTNALGKQLKVSGGVLSGNFVVGGVLESLPLNSHLQFDFLMPLAFLLQQDPHYRESDGWEWPNFITYLSLHEQADPKETAQKLGNLISTHAGEGVGYSSAGWSVGLQPLEAIHLESTHLEDPVRNKGDIKDVQFFSLIALFILLMAWINYTNLSTAQAIQRAKEVGVRKSIGASRKQLILQFLAESVLINALAGLLCIGIGHAMMPLISQITGLELHLQVVRDPGFWLLFSAAILLGAVLSGLYPAFILSSFKPVSIFSAAKHAPARRFSLRKGLIVFQFAATAILLSATFLVYRQIGFMKTQDLGVDMEQILVVNGPRVFLEDQEGSLHPIYQTFKNKVAAFHAIEGVTATSQVPGKGHIWSGDVRRLGAPEAEARAGNAVLVDADFTSAYQFSYLAGTAFTKEMSEYEGVLINEKALQAFSLGSAAEAVGQRLVMATGDTVKVVGVVQNMHWNSLRDAHLPTLFTLSNEYGAYFSIKMKLTDIPNTLAHVETAYQTTFPNDPFSYFFLDDDFNRQYQADLKFGGLFSAFSVLALLIACLGLFALVSYSAGLRIKEIGIRKVLGASTGQLMLLLSREYLLLLLIALIVAMPVVLLWGRSWLDNYAFQVGIGVEIVLIPGLLLFGIALLTISYRTYFIARANPVDALRKD